MWHERLLVEIDKEEANEDIGLFLAIIDLNTKKYIGKCIIPVDNIIFGEQYPCDISSTSLPSFYTDTT